jgi:hypothetical protein
MTLSEDIKAALRIEDEFRRDGHELRKVGVQFVTLCPWHSEKTPSCYISSHKGRFHCFGCGVDGTVIDYTALKRGITPTDAIKELAARMSRGSADSNGRSQSAKPKPPGAPYSPTPRALPKLPLLYNGGTRDLVNLALLRKISVEALRLATSGGLLWFCDLKDGPELVRAWVITDHTRRNAQGRRLDGEHWRHVWGGMPMRSTRSLLFGQKVTRKQEANYGRRCETSLAGVPKSEESLRPCNCLR